MALSTFTVHPPPEEFSFPWTETLSSLNNNNSPSPVVSPPPGHPLSVSMNLTTLRTSYRIIQYIFLFVTGLFQLASSLQGSSKLEHVSEFPSFLRLNNIPSYACTTFRLSIWLWMDTWAASPFWLCASCCCELRGTTTGPSPCFHSFWVEAQQQRCWSVWDPISMFGKLAQFWMLFFPLRLTFEQDYFQQYFCNFYFYIILNFKNVAKWYKKLWYILQPDLPVVLMLPHLFYHSLPLYACV